MVSSQNSVNYLEAIQYICLNDLEELYWAARATLISSREFVREFDAVFEEYFHLQNRQNLEFGRKKTADTNETDSAETVRSITGQSGSVDLDVSDGPSPRGRASWQEHLSAKTFEPLTDEERRYLAKISALAKRFLPSKKSRRYRSSNIGSMIDLRRCIDQLPRYDGELIRLVHKRRRPWRRSVVILIDVSGSMSLQVRSNILFSRALAQAVSEVECFCIGTRLTRISEGLSRSNIELCFEEIGGAVVDWEGGTRLGDALESFLSEQGNFERIRGAELFVLSDGLERGDPRKLLHNCSRLARNSKNMYWISPLAGGADYQPVTRAMKALVPTIGHPYPGANLAEIYNSVRAIWVHSSMHSNASKSIC